MQLCGRFYVEMHCNGKKQKISDMPLPIFNLQRNFEVKMKYTAFWLLLHKQQAVSVDVYDMIARGATESSILAERAQNH